jgi:hypothetical protein
VRNRSASPYNCLLAGTEEFDSLKKRFDDANLSRFALLFINLPRSPQRPPQDGSRRTLEQEAPCLLPLSRLSPRPRRSSNRRRSPPISSPPTLSRSRSSRRRSRSTSILRRRSTRETPLGALRTRESEEASVASEEEGCEGEGEGDDGGH